MKATDKNPDVGIPMSKAKPATHISAPPGTPSKVICPYCQKPAALINCAVRYPHRPDLAKKWMYECRPCDASVGCHPKTINPLGSMANASLRKLRNRAHASFDPYWKGGRMKRRQAYVWLSVKLGIAEKDCHIGMFDHDMCKKVIQFMKLERGD